MNLKKYYKEKFDLKDKAIELCENAEKDLQEEFKKIDKNSELAQMKVLYAMQKHKLSEAHFSYVSGYGYNDIGREVVEDIYATIFNTEDALVRPQLISGTHALTTTLFANLKSGDELLSPAGTPYDTLQGVIGIRETKGSLIENGVTYKEVSLLDDFSFDYEKIRESINEKTKMVTIQRSKGYSFRKAFTIEDIKELIAFVKSIKPDVICMVDNCYGEFVENVEPTDVGADLCVGSLIKNPGGGLAPVGGYIVGKKELIENCAYRLTAPGLGKEVGPTLGVNSQVLQGLFLAPSVVASSLKGAVLFAKVFEQLNYDVMPKSDDIRSDIVQAINLSSGEEIINFCRGIQRSAPVDSFVVPEPWGMPGYDADVIMAAGAFIQGSSIELSADAPIKPPYTVYVQGGLTYNHAKLGVMMSINNII